eukprot:TRINITY_DN7885_c0_g1_i2.p1 TRINITY_DN7885_c0_g1~~TRINITY_DN7885_c0_g1_i2.p1  ORF type:complete len:271 (-),score=6.80 TRINITY_DN7885_c0_g1_i2:293-1105(-)
MLFSFMPREYIPACTSALLFFCLDLALQTNPSRVLLRSCFLQNSKLSEDGVQKAVSQLIARIVGAVHLMIQIPLAFIVLSQEELAQNTMFGHSNYSEMLVAVSTGFFLHDCVMCWIRLNEEGAAYLIHGCCCCYTFSFFLVTQNMHWYGAAFLMWELSTPFVHLRWLLYKLGKEESIAYVLTFVCMFIAFFLARNVWGTYVQFYWLYDVYRSIVLSPKFIAPNYILVSMFIGGATLGLLNWYWLIKMVNAVYRVVIQKQSITVVSQGKDE